MRRPEPDDLRSHKERMQSGGQYQAFDPEVRADYERAQRTLRRVNATDIEATAEREPLLRELMGAVGEGCNVLPPLRCDYGYPVHLGDRVFINYGAVLIDTREIRIGDDVLIGPNVQLLTADHPLDPTARHAGWESGRPITIGDGAWLGAGVIVLPGVTIGTDTAVGAGAVVTRDLPPGVVAVGNPARVVRHLGPGQGPGSRASRRSAP
jgi:maltose O-acetyltransferase